MGRRNSHDDFGGSFIQRTLAALTSPFRGFMDDAFSGRSGIRSDRTFGQQLLHWLTSPLRFLTGFAVFLVQAWASSRSGWKFLLGLPSLAVIAVFLLGVWFVGYYPNRIYGCAAAGMAQAIEMINDREARDRGRVQNVKFAEALVRMRPESEPDKYRLGMAAARDEEIPFASDVMRKLAPDDSVGLSDAHLWRAAYFQNEKWFQGSDDQRDSMVLKHLDMAIEQSPDNKRAHEQMSEIQIRKAATFDEGTSERREFLEKGLEHSIAMVQGGIRTQSDLLAILRIIRLNKELFGLKAARKQFDRMETNLLAPLAERAPNVFEVWMVLVSCGIELEDFDLAQRFVRQGFVTSDSQSVRSDIAKLSSIVLLRQADLADDMSDANQYVTRLNALTRAINVNPKNREIYGKLVKFIASDAGDQFNMEWFEEARVDSPDPGVLATMLGLRAILDGKEETARTHWRVSQQLYTLSELVLNHLIVVGSREELAEFSQPTELLTESLKSFPGSPVLLQSRGFFYTKDPETYQLAVSDFENALEKLPNLLEARKFLVLLHNELGNTAEADRNERRLEDALKVVSEDQLEKLTERLSRLTL